MWKQLIHDNIVPFKGVTLDPFQIVSEWMPGGDLTGYINTNPHVSPVKLVSLVLVPRNAGPYFPISWLMSPRGWNISIFAT